MCWTGIAIATAVDDAARLDRVRRLEAERNRLDAELAAAVRDAEVHRSAEGDGLKSMRSWLPRTPCSPARRSVASSGRAAPWLGCRRSRRRSPRARSPATRSRCAEVVKPDNLDRAAAQHIDLTVVEEAVLLVATTRPHDDLRTVVGTYLARLDPDGTEIVLHPHLLAA